VDFTNSSNTTFAGPINIPVAAFNDACGGGTCIPQAGTSQQLDSLGERLMWRLAYRNFGDHEALVANHSVATGAGNVGVRWYDLRDTNGSATVFQQGTYAPDSNYRWMGSVAMDNAGDIAAGYGVSSSAMNPAVRYAGRVPSDPLNTLQTETSIIEGAGSQLPSLSRWGDYSSMSVDPVDDCTFWYTNEYLLTSGTFNWSTRIATFKFPSCGGVPTADFSIGATPQSATADPGASAMYTVTVTPSNGYGGTVNLTVSGLPSGANASFSLPSMAPPYGSSTLTVGTSTATPAGSYLLTISGTDSTGTPAHSTTVTMVVNLKGGFTVSATPFVPNPVSRGGKTGNTVTATANGNFNGTVTFSASGLPPRSNATFNPTSIIGSGSATLTIQTLRKTASGNYIITITGTSGSLSSSTTVPLTVQ